MRPIFVCVAALSAPLLTVPGFAPATAQAQAQDALQPAPSPLTVAELEKIVGGPPTTITFSGQDVPVRDVIQALRKAAGGPSDTPDIVPAEVLKKPVTIDWKDLPFWKAAAQVEALTGYRWDSAQAGGIQLRKSDVWSGGDLSGVVGAQTPYFQVLGSTVNRSTNVDLPMNGGAAPPASSSLSASISVYADPKVPTAKSSLGDCQLQLTPGGEWTRVNGFDMSYGSQTPISNLRVSLPKELKPGTVIPRLTGTYQIELVHETKAWKVPDILAAPNAGETIPGAKLSLDSAKFEGGNLNVDISFTIPSRPDNMSEATEWAKAIKLTDSAGRLLSTPIQKIRFDYLGNDKMLLKMALTYKGTTTGEPITPGPVSLNWTLPTLSRSFSIPFELKDIKVP